MKRHTTALGVLALVVAGASVALVGGSSTSGAAGTPSEAYGVAATGLVPIAKTPVTVSNDGRLHSDTVAPLPDNPLLSASLVTTSARNGAASVRLADLAVRASLLRQRPHLGAQLAPLCDALALVDIGFVTGPDGRLDLERLEYVTGDLPLDEIDLEGLELGGLSLDRLAATDIAVICDVLAGIGTLAAADTVTVACEGDSGEVSVAGLVLLGVEVPVPSTAPNTQIPAEPVLEVTINQQTRHTDGTYTVQGVVISLLDGSQDIVLGSATCGRVTDDQDPDDPAGPPTPVPTNFPVTG